MRISLNGNTAGAFDRNPRRVQKVFMTSTSWCLEFYNNTPKNRRNLSARIEDHSYNSKQVDRLLGLAVEQEVQTGPPTEHGWWYTPRVIIGEDRLRFDLSTVANSMSSGVGYSYRHDCDEHWFRKRLRARGKDSGYDEGYLIQIGTEEFVI